ncbi:ATP-dependent DNA ligase [Prosthecochloris marina]|uniref:ATP-dependent DNA ligase n=1 Tax=Prosthecochloris marina TaxID=2017681 RepID=A0A317TBX4_9CHLB|nr:DUF4198 domain-containing protein [Prosthecochloris marina]PWW83326.1 ATP-dependent DNA ligase [Prosthecochloris marina]
MKNTTLLWKSLVALTLFTIVFVPIKAYAHFGMVIPSEDIVEKQSQSSLTVNIMFAHPFEGQSMNMEKPELFGVFSEGRKKQLTPLLKTHNLTMYADSSPNRAWRAYYTVKHPGDHIFFMEPKPYWEPAEDSYIVHYTKVIVNAFGKEDGWDSELGLKTEIIPLTRPYGLYTGNVFQGIVKVDGKPSPFSEVEVEYFNQSGENSAPKPPFITQVVKTDKNGVFSYAIPKTGWWGFAALSTDSRTIMHDGEPKPVEIGAVLWVKAEDFK